jgi:hypothetical protein
MVHPHYLGRRGDCARAIGHQGFVAVCNRIASDPRSGVTALQTFRPTLAP